MRKILTLILLLPLTGMFSQNELTPEITEISKSDLKFTDLKNSSDIFSFRLKNDGQYIDFRILSDSTKIGEIINFVEQSYGNRRTYNRISSGKIIPIIYKQKINLTEIEVEKALKIIEKSRIIDLPSDSEIKEWIPILDGNGFGIEQKVKGVYKNKTYGNPKLQKELPETKIFLDFHCELDNAINFKNKFSDYFSKLDYGCYDDKSGVITCKKRKNRWWKFWRW
jgi:hypothetical protein